MSGTLVWISVGLIFLFLLVVSIVLEPDVQLVSAWEIIHNDRDGYFQRMTASDLAARGARTVDEYKEREKEKLENVKISKEMHQKLAAAIRSAKQASAALRFEDWGVDRARFLEMPWKIALVTSNTYEGGLPHTRGDTIFLPVTLLDRADVARTILHEQVHVYQKKYSSQVALWLSARGFRQTEMKRPVRMRNNPDTDGAIWTDPAGRPMYIEYSKLAPAGVEDTAPGQDVTREHPWEWMAYGLVR